MVPQPLAAQHSPDAHRGTCRETHVGTCTGICVGTHVETHVGALGHAGWLLCSAPRKTSPGGDAIAMATQQKPNHRPVGMIAGRKNRSLLCPVPGQ